MSEISVDLKDFTAFVVTGTTVYGRRFRKEYPATAPGFHTAFGINLWQGSVWGVRKDTGRRTLLNRVYN